MRVPIISDVLVSSFNSLMVYYKSDHCTCGQAILSRSATIKLNM